MAATKFTIFLAVLLLSVGCVYGDDQPSDMRLYTYSSDSILLIWDSPTDTNHKIDNYRLNISGGQQRSLLVGTIGWMVVEHLKPSTNYTMTLEARYAKNKNFGKPAQATATTFAKGTDMPRDLTAEVISGTAVKLTWKPPVNTCPVNKVYVVEVGGRTYDVDYDEFTGTYTVNGLARGHKYKISVSVFYEFPGYSAPAAQTTVTTPSRKLKLPSN
nr:unnamed protein product [Spirometra erinaceieuropaei]